MPESETINAKITRWENSLNEVSQAIRTHFGDLSTEKLHQKPDPNTWSIAENLDHLIKINESYYPVVSQLRNGTLKLPFVAKIGFLTNMLGNFILKSVAPDRKTKVKTFQLWEPTAGPQDDTILDRFEKHQKELIRFIKSSRDLLAKNAVVTSPANKMIVYKLEKAFDILTNHEKRHLNQALELLDNR